MTVDYLNDKLNQLPPHLKQFMVNQDYDAYTPIDHAVWRYVMRLNTNYLAKVAHVSYLDGLKKTGITLDKIPDIKDMNRILNEIGWAACTVDGFINPQAFMEFQMYKVLVIAADIRQLKHIEYTPAPDIIHEAAGHAPIISDEAYADYLRYFGEIGSKAFSSSKDFELFEAIRHLSIIKEDPYTDPKDIEEGELRIENIAANLGNPSEMSLIRRLHWWTVEYGLIGSLENPKIYGAGLLSSIGESVWCMKDEVKKLPYTVKAADYDFDITKPQPQLFVTPDFEHLTAVLDEFAESMAWKRGGAYGLELAKDSNAIATVVFSGGASVSGVLRDFETDEMGNPSYVFFYGPSAIAEGNKQLPNHGVDYHKDGFGSPLGKWKNIEQLPENLTPAELDSLNIRENEKVNISFENGVEVQGTLRKIYFSSEGKLMLLSFDDCTVKEGDRILFDPSWGVFDMAIGSAVVSVYNGAADSFAYPVTLQMPGDSTHKINYDARTKELMQMYQDVRNIRDGKSDIQSLPDLYKRLHEQHADDWLCALEIYELLNEKDILPDLKERIYADLNKLAAEQNAIKKLIEDGLTLCGAQPLHA